MTLIIKELIIKELIIKELIIKGIVTKDDIKDAIDADSLRMHLEQMKREIKKDCIEAVLSKMNSTNKR